MVQSMDLEKKPDKQEREGKGMPNKRGFKGSEKRASLNSQGNNINGPRKRILEDILLLRMQEGGEVNFRS